MTGPAARVDGARGGACGSGPVRVVAEALFALGDGPAGHALEGGEGPALVRDDPHVDHRRLVALDQAVGAVAGVVGEARDLGAREAQVVVHVPLGERAYDIVIGDDLLDTAES